MTEEEEIKSLRKEFNKLVREHNHLVDDSEALMQFMQAITLGMRNYVTGNQEPRIRYISDKEVLIAEEGRLFAQQMHNEMIDFLLKIRAGTRPTEALDVWLKKCQEIANATGFAAGQKPQNKRGIILQ